MWEIERGTRCQGMRLGTIYAIAQALNVEVAELFPSVRDALVSANTHVASLPRLVVKP